MKKLVTLFTLAIAGAAMAQVTSQNVVGYKNAPVTQGFNMLGLNFDAVGNPEGGLSLDQVFPPTTPGLTGATTVALGADTIQVYDNSAKEYATYFLYYTTKTTSLSTLNWTWRVNQNTPATAKLHSGDAVWFNKKGEQPVSFALAGQVPTVSSKDRVILPGFNMIASVYASDWDPNALGQDFWKNSGAVGATTVALGADTIQVYDNSTKEYATYFLYYTTKTTSLSTLNWTWRVNQNTVAPANFVSMGVGAWYNSKSAGSITLPITCPYSL